MVNKERERITISPKKDLLFLLDQFCKENHISRTAAISLILNQFFKKGIDFDEFR